MEESTPKVEDSTDEQLIEDICQLKGIALGEGAAACQVCGTELPDGADVTVYAYRPAGRPTYELGHVICGDREHDLPTYFTLGVRELILDGHIGRCTDPITNTSWPVLLDPAVRAVSTVQETTGRIAPTQSRFSSTDPTPTTRGATEPTTSTDVTWVYGDALLKRTSSHDADAPTDTDSHSTTEEFITAEDSTPTGRATSDYGHESTESDETDPTADGGEC